MRFDRTRESGRVREGVVFDLEKMSYVRGDLKVRESGEECVCRSTCGYELARGSVLLV